MAKPSARLTAREGIARAKAWLAGHLKTEGRVMLDAGAAKALLSGGKSLLPVGVTQVDGTFDRGDMVSCVDSSGGEIARGLVNYSSGRRARSRENRPGRLKWRWVCGRGGAHSPG